MNNNITKLKNFQKFNTLPFHIDIISPTKTIDPHYHDCAEMIFVKTGHMVNRIDSSPFNHSPGNLFLISGSVSHTMFGFKDFSAYRLLFDMSIFNDFDEDLKNSDAFLSLFAMSNLSAMHIGFRSVMSLNHDYRRRLASVLDEILYAYEEGGILTENYIKSLFYSATSLIIKQYNEKSQYKTYYNPQMFNAFFEILNENTNIAEFADRFQISSTYLYKLFKTHFKKSPKQLIKELRIRNAKTLLALTDKSITEIAADCGFDNPVYFTEVFKACEGVSPSKYRKNTKKGDV